MHGQPPWLWPHNHQAFIRVGALLLGLVLLAPWWLQGGQAWSDATQAQARLQAQQHDTRTLREQTAQLVQAASQTQVQLAEASVISQLAQPQGLTLMNLRVERPITSGAMQVQPVHVTMQGPWAAWLAWLAQLPAGVTITALEIKAAATGGIAADVTVSAPHQTVHDHEAEAGSRSLGLPASRDPFDALRWKRTQTAEVQQHPSYAKWVAPELARAREPLEAFARERLQYVGQIATATERHAPIRVLPASSEKKDALMMSVYRVRVGHHLGQDFGRVRSITQHHLLVQELVRLPSGEWQSRDVRLPLHEASS